MRRQDQIPARSSIRGRGVSLSRRRVVYAALLGLLLLVAGGLPLGPLSHLTPTASAHAVLVKSEPAANAILQAPPSEVRLWFSEAINPFTSKAVVVDPTNHEVDRGDSHRNPNNDHEMDVSLQLLPAGTYIVDWRTQSEEDGHIVGSSFIFRIARPDGSVPPVPNVLPTGHFPGAAGAGVPSGSTIDPPTALQGLGTFLALLLMTFWVGGVFWETWILPPRDPGEGTRDPALARATRAATRRFARLAPYALGGVIVADVAMILGQSAELAGSWQGAVSPVLLGAILFGSRFGTFWWLRQIVALAALLLAITVLQRDGSRAAGDAGLSAAPGQEATAAAAIPDWRRELLETARKVKHLPRRLVHGWQGRNGLGRIECILAGALLVAFALSGHAAAVPANQFAYAIAVDLLHLLCEAAWIGGLFYIGAVLIPALRGLSPLERARVLALGLPEFGAVAIVCATLLAATGSLNTTIHLESITQFLTTSYGRTLAIKIEIFLVMVGISFYHAFVLRPRLSRALNGLAGTENAEGAERRGGRGEREQRLTAEDAEGRGGVQRVAENGEASGRVPRGGAVRATHEWLLIGAAGATTTAREGTRQSVAADGQRNGASVEPPGVTAPGVSGDLPPRVGALADKLRDWLRREALLAGAVLLCVALLAIFAGSLVPTAPASAASTSPGVFLQTQQSGGYAVTLKVTPAAFGTNTFTVTVKNAQGQPVTGAAVVIEETMLDMDMGTQNVQLQPIGASAPGSYSGQAELTMAGHWQIAVKVLLPKVQQPLVVTYKFSAGY
ncbi:MAG TPA: copper resistance protein CopC [Ktedonobacterales bacterium]